MPNFFGNPSEPIVEGRVAASRPTRRERMEKAFQELFVGLSPHGTVEALGSYGRGEQEPGDLDVLFVGTEDGFDVQESIRKTSATNVRRHAHRIVCTMHGTIVEVWISPPETAGAAKLYLEGPLRRNVELRRIAITNGIRWTFHGLTDMMGQSIPCHDRLTALSWIMPFPTGEDR